MGRRRVRIASSETDTTHPADKDASQSGRIWISRSATVSGSENDNLNEITLGFSYPLKASNAEKSISSVITT
jgi:hypothetical protein